MDREKIKEIETSHSDSSWNREANDDGMFPEFEGIFFESVYQQLKANPDLYFIKKKDSSPESIQVFRRGDKKMVYYTEDLGEIDILKKIGTENK